MRPRLLSLVAFSLTASAMSVLSPATAGDSPIKPSTPPEMAQPEQTAQLEIIEVVTQGIGNDANSALLNAYSNAVQQALGLYVDAETMVQNDRIIHDQILTYSKGFIQGVVKINEIQTNGLFQVDIRAKVKRQQLLAQMKANNISTKKVDGASLHVKVQSQFKQKDMEDATLHAQTQSQLKQNEDAIALLNKALKPLTDIGFYRAVLADEEPTIVKDKTTKDVTTLNYKYYLVTDEQEYMKYIQNSLIPVLDQIAEKKKQLMIELNNCDNYGDYCRQYSDFCGYEEICILIWRDTNFKTSKWLKYSMPQYHSSKELPSKLPITIEIGLFNGKAQLLTSGSETYGDIGNSCIACNYTNPYSEYSSIEVSPFNNIIDNITGHFFYIPLKENSLDVKISNEDLPNLISAKLEIKPIE